MTTEPMTETLPETEETLPAPAPAEHQAWPVAALEGELLAHARVLPAPLPIDYVIPRPYALPETISAPVSVLVPGRYQPRTTFAPDGLVELADSIRTYGVITPLLVFANERGELELIAGERRLRAARSIGLTRVPVTIRAVSLRQAAEISGLDNIQRAQLAPLEEGAYFEQLISQLGCGESELARRLGLGRAYVQQRRLLARKLAPAAREALAAGTITFTHSRVLCELLADDPEQQAAMVKQITTTRMGVTETLLREWIASEGARRAEAELRARGWHRMWTSDGEIWLSAGDAPASWAPDEVTRRWREGVAPSPAPEAAPVDAARLGVVLRYGKARELALGWYRRDTRPAQFVRAPELLAAHADLLREYDGMVATMAELGWAPEPHAQPWGEYWSNGERRLSSFDLTSLRSLPTRARDMAAPAPAAAAAARPLADVVGVPLAAVARRVEATLALCPPAVHAFLTRYACELGEADSVFAWVMEACAVFPTLVDALLPDPDEALALEPGEGSAIVSADLRARAAVLGLQITPERGGYILHWPDEDLRDLVFFTTRAEVAQFFATSALDMAAERWHAGTLELASVGLDVTTRLTQDDVVAALQVACDVAALEAGWGADAPAHRREQLALCVSALEGAIEVFDDATYSALANRLTALEQAEVAHG